ncbi:S-layer homology domain-containing protein [Candidatus Peregrinibacteria bacterium]|nr:S-layer homology domain-containing protein [Candidatus Peregrinibacteria bacterium]
MRRWKLFYVLSGIIVSGLLVNSFLSKENASVFQTSVLPVIKGIADQNPLAPPDLSIENIELKKVSDPTFDSNYYKYKASVVVRNTGGNLVDSNVTLHGDFAQKYVYVKNVDKGFSLPSGKSYAIDNYDITFDGNYNGGEIPVTIEVQDKVDTNLVNNTFKVEIFELPPKLNPVKISDIPEDGKVVLNVNSKNLTYRDDDFLLYTRNSTLNDEKVIYSESKGNDGMYSFYAINPSKSYFKNGFGSEKVDNSGEYPVTADYAYVKAVDPKTGYYAVSDIVKLAPSKEINRAEFAKIFVDEIGIEPSTYADSYYSDVLSDDWFFPYVQTLYDIGLLNTDVREYEPNQAMTRGEVLKMVLTYFDADLAVQDDTVHFKDVDEGNDIYPYAESLLVAGKAEAIRGELNPELPATKDFLIYLINEYRKSN